MYNNNNFFKSSTEEDLSEVPIQPKVLTLSGLPLHEKISINSIAPLDCHQYEEKDYFSLSIDGNPVEIQSLSRKIPHTASTLTLEWCAKSSNESNKLFVSPFVVAIVTIIGIRNSSKIANIIPDPTVYAYSNFDFTINAITISDIDGESLILRAKLEQGEAFPTHRSLIPPEAISITSPSVQV
ncbi:hypothetical protein [Mastigocoleus testarum]|uniref:Uncharacterized protein n=1 Tax=Mastigocoleus testarum BC008 TaxID=371196 RepID=A0A0V7ZHL0_9CYAN|nr:hypothetical protein [Mastigocoleus testarum]KST63965.1 hypothetical protein BC008_39890 [Mastigocoleus testarum BC008]KST64675.1 hypothetical protein BC008_40865 [Mastigocoleus testarum BC008]